MEFAYKFPVVKGIQAGREYYIVMVPLKMISKIFPRDDEYVLPEYRAQRRLNEARIPVISKYIIENRDSYVFSALAASIDGKFEFHESKDMNGTGVLEISMDARFLINDGQHRKAAILEALNEDKTLENETIPLVLFEDLGLARSQQIFTDLNKHAIKTSNSIAELYDSRDKLSVLNRNVVNSVSFFNEYTDKEKDILGKFSSNLFTLNTFYTANKRAIGGKDVTKADEDFLIKYWSLVSQNIVQWRELVDRSITKVDLRENFIITQNVVIQALGILASYFYKNPSVDMNIYIKKLQNIDWRRNSNQWKSRVIRNDGRMIAGDKAVNLIANQIKKNLGIELSIDEQSKEEQFIKLVS